MWANLRWIMYEDGLQFAAQSSLPHLAAWDDIGVGGVMGQKLSRGRNGTLFE